MEKQTSRSGYKLIRWIVVQAKRRSPDGPIIEKIGYWLPRTTKTVNRSLIINKERLSYWLSVGAQPSDKVHHFLAMLGHLPPKPKPFGSTTCFSTTQHQPLTEKFKSYKFDYGKNFVDNNLLPGEYYSKRTDQMADLLKLNIEEYKVMLKKLYAKKCARHV